MSLQLILSSYLYSLFFVGFTAGVLLSYHSYSGLKNPKLGKVSIIIIHITTLLLTISQIALMVIMVRVDTSFQVVANSSANWMSVWARMGASWTDRWGSYHLWTWFTWIITSILFHKLYDENQFDKKSKSIRYFEILLWGSIIILFLLMGQRPYRAVEGIVFIPRGLTPSLLSIWNVLHPPLAFASYTGFFISWTFSSFIWLRNPDMKIPIYQQMLRYDRIITRITWVMTSLMLAFGIVWSYEANWGGYWSWDSVQVVAVILWLIAGYRLHLHEVGKNQSLFLLLGIVGFPLVFFAAWIITSNILLGLHSYANSPVAPLFLMLMFLTLIPLVIGWWKHKWQPMSPVRVSNDIVRPTGFNLGIISFNLLVLGNFLIIILQIIDAVLELNKSYETLYPLFNGIGFSGIVVGLILDIVQKKSISIRQYIATSLIALIGLLLFWFPHKDIWLSSNPVVDIFKSIMIGLIMFAIPLLIINEFNVFSRIRKSTLKRLVSHLAMLFIFLTIIANGAGPSVDTRQLYILETGDEVSVDKDITIILMSISDPLNQSGGNQVDISLQIIRGNEKYNREISIIEQANYTRYVKSTWVTFSDGKELFMNLQRGDPVKIEGSRIVRIHLITEIYLLTVPIWISIVLFLIVPFIPLVKLSKK